MKIVNNWPLFLAIVLPNLYFSTVHADDKPDQEINSHEFLVGEKLHLFPVDSVADRVDIRNVIAQDWIENRSNEIPSESYISKAASALESGFIAMAAGKSPQFLGFVVRTKTGELRGLIKLYQTFPSFYWRTGTIILPNYRGQGIGEEARRLTMDYLFEQVNAPGLTSLISPTNEPSLNLTKKLGFLKTQTTQIIDDSGNKERWVDYRLAKQTYEGLLPSRSKFETWKNSKPTVDSIKSSFPKRDNTEMSSGPMGNFLVSGVYHSLLQDSFLLDRLGYEMLSVVAENLARESPVNPKKFIEKILKRTPASQRKSNHRNSLCGQI